MTGGITLTSRTDRAQGFGGCAPHEPTQKVLPAASRQFFSTSARDFGVHLLRRALSGAPGSDRDDFRSRKRWRRCRSRPGRAGHHPVRGALHEARGVPRRRNRSESGAGRAAQQAVLVLGRRAQARPRGWWCRRCSARRARWCRPRPSPTCCGSPPRPDGRTDRAFSYDPSGTVESTGRGGTACGGHRSRVRGVGRRPARGPGAGGARPGRRGVSGGDDRRRPLDRTGPGPARPGPARRRPRRGGPGHGAVVDRPTPGRDAAAGSSTTTAPPIAGDLLAGIAATDERELSGIWSTASGVLGRLPQRGRPGHHRWPPTSTPAPSAIRLPLSIYVPPDGTRRWLRPWWWACSPTSGRPPTPVGGNGRWHRGRTQRRDGGRSTGPGGARPRRGGQHRPRARPAGHGE